MFLKPADANNLKHVNTLEMLQVCNINKFTRIFTTNQVQYYWEEDIFIKFGIPSLQKL